MSSVNGNGHGSGPPSERGSRSRSSSRPVSVPGSSSIAPALPGLASVVEEQAAARAPAGTDLDVDAAGYVGVVFDRPLETTFTYRIPEALRDRIRPGQRVRVPLGRGNTPTIGYCVELHDVPPGSLSPGRIKPVLDALDDPPLIDDAMLELTRWLARYYACSWGQALDAAIPGGVKKQAGTRIRNVLIVNETACEDPERLEGLSAKQAAALEVIRRSAHPLTVADVARRAACGTGPIAALRQRGLVRMQRERGGLEDLDSVLIPTDGLFADADGSRNGPASNGHATATGSESETESESNGTSHAAINATDAFVPTELTDGQQVAMRELMPVLEDPRYTTFLLHGVTGSGKTEVYLRAIEEVVQRGREAIVLVPEISLTPQTIRRFRRRFDRVAVLHSHLSDAERHRHWQAIATGRVQVVVGARSAIFAPARRLGLIVIDEEHETTFKQETVPRYHARDVAIKRAHLCQVPVILGSATPSLESWHNAETGRFVRIDLPRRVSDRPMPRVELVDLRRDRPRAVGAGKAPGALSEPLRIAVQSALNDGGQVILLLNRRGFHTFVLCPNCGYVFQCAACDVALTHHRSRHKLVCHTCDAEQAPPAACPECQHPNPFFGGLGTEQLERQVREAFPGHALARTDSDTMRHAGSYERTLAAFRDGETRILLGTQMIAKGLDFPGVTLVGVVNADTGLHLPDFRAAERTFQLITQVAGRTGRGDRPGRVLVQTFCPEEPAIRLAARHDYQGFLATEMPVRRRHELPPFGRLVRVMARGEEERAVAEFLTAATRTLAHHAAREVHLLGPAPAPVLKVRNMYRYHLQLRAPDPRPLQRLLRAALPLIEPPSGVELAVDVDPVQLM